jgi:hypothetical protein
MHSPRRLCSDWKRNTRSLTCLLGILNMEAGIRDVAMRHLGQVPPTDPHAAVAQRSRERVLALGAAGQTR